MKNKNSLKEYETSIHRMKNPTMLVMVLNGEKSQPCGSYSFDLLFSVY